MVQPMLKPSPATPALTSFLADKDEATKAKYAAELANADAGEWRAPLDMWYAESLVYFGELERQIETLYSGKIVRGSRTWFRKVRKDSTRLYESAYRQTEMVL